MLYLMKRDYELINFLLEMKYCTLRQVARKFWGVEIFNASNRTAKLQSGGYVVKLWTHLRKKLIVATPLGYRLLKEKNDEEPPPPLTWAEAGNGEVDLDLAGIVHDLGVTDIRIVLEEILTQAGVKHRWVCERRLVQKFAEVKKSDRIKIPDGALVVEGKAYAVEYDRTLRWGKKHRLSESLGRFARIANNFPGGLIYIVPNSVDPEKIKKQALEAASDTKNRSKYTGSIYVTTQERLEQMVFEDLQRFLRGGVKWQKNEPQPVATGLR